MTFFREIPPTWPTPPPATTGRLASRYLLAEASRSLRNGGSRPGQDSPELPPPRAPLALPTKAGGTGGLWSKLLEPISPPCKRRSAQLGKCRPDICDVQTPGADRPDRPTAQEEQGGPGPQWAAEGPAGRLVAGQCPFLTSPLRTHRRASPAHYKMLLRVSFIRFRFLVGKWARNCSPGALRGGSGR